MSIRKRGADYYNYGTLGRFGMFSKRMKYKYGYNPYKAYNFYPWAKKKSANAKATNALKLIRKLKKEQEIKNITDDNTLTITQPNGYWVQTGIGLYTSQGSARNNRIGNRVTMKDLAMRIQIKLSALETKGIQIRLILVYDREPNNANLGIPYIFKTNNDVTSLYTTDDKYLGRFQMLFDKIFNVKANETFKYMKFYTRYPFKIVYNANYGDVNDCVKGNFILAAMADHPVADIAVNYHFKFRFVDD